MTGSKEKRRLFTEETVTRVMSTACYLSLPLILLFALTIGISLPVTGGINTDVNAISSFYTVLAIFSLPMILALAVVPLIFKTKLQRRSAAEMGLDCPKNALNIGFCALMTVGSAVLAVILSASPDLDTSALTVLVHFLFVAVAEEIMLRCVIMDELKAFTGNKWVLCLLNGLLFAFVYHSNEAFLPNLMIRVPLGFVLSMVRLRSNSVYPAIGLHWFYNMLVTVI